MRSAQKVIKRVPHFKTAIITGVASYLGASLAEHLLKEGFRVVGIASPKTAFKQYLALFEGNPRFFYQEADLTGGIPENIKSADYFYHLQEVVPPYGDPSSDKPSSPQEMLSCLQRGETILRFCSENKIRLILGSSMRLYATNWEGDFLENLSFLEKLALRYQTYRQGAVVIARLPFYYGKHFLLEKPQHPLASLVRRAQEGKPLVIAGSGLQKYWYLHIDNLTARLLALGTQRQQVENPVALSGKEPVTLLELAYLVKGANAYKTEVEFAPPSRREEAELDYPSLPADSLWQDGDIPLKQGLAEIFAPSRVVSSAGESEEKKSPSLERILPKKPSFNLYRETNARLPGKAETVQRLLTNFGLPRKKLFFARFKRQYRLWQLKLSGKKLLSAGVVALPLVLPVLYPVGNCLFAGWKLREAERDLRARRFAESARASKQAGNSLKRASDFLAKLPLAPVVLGEARYARAQKLLSAGRYATETAYYEASGLDTLVASLASALPSTSASPPTESELITASANFSKGWERYQLFRAETKDLSVQQIPSPFRATYEKLKESEREISLNLETIFSLSKNLPELLGMTAPRNYLVLLQNNQELRAGGGFIGSYLFITLDGGKVTQLLADDVYNLDGLLEEKGARLPAPQYLRQYLGISQVYLRDSNFSADFTENAQRARDLYKRATGDDVDGVIAVNLSVVPKLLEVFGELDCGDYGKVTAENVLEKAMYFAEKDYFDGAQKKKSFMGALAQAFTARLADNADFTLTKLARVVYSSLNEKEVLVSFFQGDWQKAIATRNWAGKSRQEAWDGDYLSVVESNLGANKANYTIERHIQYEVSETDRSGQLSAKLTISYFNRAEGNRWPLGDYQVYGQVLTAKGAKVFWKTVKPQESEAVSFSWRLPKEITSRNYKLLVQKQPGMENTAFGFFYRPALRGEERSFEGYLTKDLNFDINSWR